MRSKFRSEPMCLRELLSGKQVLKTPAFQRRYAWTPKEAGQLIVDLLHDFVSEPEPASPAEVFLGTILLLSEVGAPAQLPGGADPAGFARLLQALARAEGDDAEIEVEQDGRAAHVRRTGWRLMRDIDSPPWSVFEAWNGLFEGALSVHNRFLVLECLGREDYGDPHTHWRIRTRG